MNRVPAIVKFCTPTLALTSLLVMASLVAALPLQADDARPIDLDKLIDKADKLVVLETPRKGAKILFESTERRDMDGLKSALKVEHPKQFLHCMCDGTPALVLYAKG